MCNHDCLSPVENEANKGQKQTDLLEYCNAYQSDIGRIYQTHSQLNCPKLDRNMQEQQRARWEANLNIRKFELFPA